MAKTKVKKNSWFIEGKQHNRQVGLYKLFVEKKGISVGTLTVLIFKFRDTVLLPRITSNRKRKLYDLHRNNRPKLLYLVSTNFEEFLELVTRETGVEFNINTHKKKVEDKLDAQFAEEQLDFMMNGGSIDDL